MEDLSNELNKSTINKFPRKKIIVSHVNEIHSIDLVDMTQYSKINKGYKYIFTNIGVFSKIAHAYPIKSNWRYAMTSKPNRNLCQFIAKIRSKEMIPKMHD